MLLHEPALIPERSLNVGSVHRLAASCRAIDPRLKSRYDVACIRDAKATRDASLVA